MKTSENLVVQDMWTSLVEDFRVRTSALRGGGQALLDPDQDFGVRILELFGIIDLNTQSLKTAQLYLFEDSNECYATFPRSGIMQNGNVYRTYPLDIHMKEKGSTLLPTPTKSDHKATFAKTEALHRYLKSGHQIRCMDILAHKGFLKSQRIHILEMMMGFDIGHTELEV